MHINERINTFYHFIDLPAAVMLTTTTKITMYFIIIIIQKNTYYDTQRYKI